MKKIIPYVILLILGIVAGWLCREYHFRDEVKMVADTLVRLDTVRYSRFELETNRHRLDVPEIGTLSYIFIETERLDTVYRDSIRYVKLPRESRTYGDERYTAVVSGYQPSLDRLEIYLENQVVTQYLQPVGERVKRNTLSLGLGVNASSALLLPVSLEYGYKLKPWFELTAEAEYELTRRQLALQIGANVQMSW